MNTSRPGNFQLSGRAYVENARPTPGKPRTVVLDVYFFGSDCNIASSLRFFKGEEAMLIIEGLYDVVATVVAFRPDVNEPSSVISETEFKLMGDVSELKPIPIPTDEVVAFSKVPATVIVHGSVTSVDESRDCFCLTPAQYVSGATQHEAIPIRAVMNRETPFASERFRLPGTNCLVGFTGKLQQFEENTEPGSAFAFRAAVSVETVSHLTGHVASYPKNSPTNTVDDSDTVALKKRLHKYVDQGDVSGRGIQCAEIETGSESSKGKRKVTLTLDGVEGKKGDRADKKRR